MGSPRDRILLRSLKKRTVNINIAILSYEKIKVILVNIHRINTKALFQFLKSTVFLRQTAWCVRV